MTITIIIVIILIIIIINFNLHADLITVNIIKGEIKIQRNCMKNFSNQKKTEVKKPLCFKKKDDENSFLALMKRDMMKKFTERRDEGPR